MPREDSSYNFHDSERERETGLLLARWCMVVAAFETKTKKKEVISVIIALGLITNDPPRTSIAGQIKN